MTTHILGWSIEKFSCFCSLYVLVPSSQTLLQHKNLFLSYWMTSDIICNNWCNAQVLKVKIWSPQPVLCLLFYWKENQKIFFFSPVQVIVVTAVQNGGLWCWRSTVGNGEKGQGKSWFAPLSFQMVPCQYTCHQVAVTVVWVPPWLHPALASCRQTYCTAILASSSQHGFHKSTRRLSC